MSRTHRRPITEYLEVSEVVVAVSPRRWSRAVGTIKRNAVAMALAGCGALQALPGMVATARPQSPTTLWVGAALWTAAAGGFVASAYGLWGFPWFRHRWKELARGAAVASFVMIVASRQADHWAVALVDLICLLAVREQRFSERSARRGWGWRAWRGLLLAGLAYGTTVTALHPWYQNWGATDDEITRPMIGDEGFTAHDHQINHVVTVDAPPERVWPWLIQIGQDRAGFYSYDLLERIAGTRIHNVYEIRPEWQVRKTGEFVRSCPRDWMGGRWADLTGWKVGKVEPNRLLYLETWGPMWLSPLPNGKTRFGIRSDVADLPFFAAPIELYLFEPIHFLMEQKMLRTIRDLSEERR